MRTISAELRVFCGMPVMSDTLMHHFFSDIIANVRSAVSHLSVVAVLYPEIDRVNHHRSIRVDWSSTRLVSHSTGAKVIGYNSHERTELNVTE